MFFAQLLMFFGQFSFVLCIFFNFLWCCFVFCVFEKQGIWCWTAKKFPKIPKRTRKSLEKISRIDDSRSTISGKELCIFSTFFPRDFQSEFVRVSCGEKLTILFSNFSRTTCTENLAISLKKMTQIRRNNETLNHGMNFLSKCFFHIFFFRFLFFNFVWEKKVVSHTSFLSHVFM